MRALLRIVFIVLCLASIAFAQSGAGMGSIEGTVQDQAGAVVPGASVEVRNVGTSQTRQVQTDATGHYLVPNVQPGEYEITFQSAGFAKLLHKGVTVMVGQAAIVNSQLKVSATQETITVTGETPLLETSKTEVSSYVTEKEMQNLPINGRRWDNYVMLTPAVGADGNYGLVSYRGISGLYNNNMIDGTDNNQAFFSEARGRTRINYAISQAAIKEFQVGTSNYSAEFGRAAGGMVNAVTKSGTNSIRGEGFYYIRDTALNATNPTMKTNSILIANNFTKPPDRRQQFGGSVGGPLVKDKVFWFMNYDQQKRNFPAAILPGSPAFLGSTGTAPALETARAFFASKVTQQDRNGNQNIGLAKVDWQITPGNLLSSTVNIFRWDSLNGIQTQANHANDITANGTDGVANEYLIHRLNSVLTPTTVNEARFQYGRDFEFQTPNAPGPYANVSSGINLGMPNFLPRAAYPNEKKFQWVDNLSMTRGRHTLKIGADIDYVRDMMINLYNGGAGYSYPNMNAFALDCTTPAIPFACSGTATTDNLVGKHYSTFYQAFDSTGQGGRMFFTNTDFAVYAQDNIKVRPNFTLQLGVRYDLETMPQPDHASALDPRTGRINTDTNNFGPRIGFSWSPLKDNKLIVRGGYGVFYGRTQNSTISNLLMNNGERILNYQFTPTTAGAPVFPNVFKGIPTGTAQKPSIVVASPGFANPIIHQFEFSLEREVVPGLSLAAMYLGSRGQRLPYFRDVNLFAPIDTVTLTVDCTANNAACATAPSSISVPFFRGPSNNRPNPNVGSIILADSVVNTWYNGLVLQARGRIGRSVSLQAAFTWSKALDNGQSSTTFTASYGQALNPFNQRAEYALSDLDQRRRFSVSTFYRPALDNLSNVAVRRLINGFQFAGILTLGDGRPVTGATNSANVSGTGVPSYLSNGPLGAGGALRAPWLGRNTFVSPGLTNIDFRVSREFKIKERSRFELLWEAFNLFNHTNITGVVGTAFDISGTRLVARGDFLMPNATNNYYIKERQMQVAARFRF